MSAPSTLGQQPAVRDRNDSMGVSRITRFGFVNAYLVTEEDGFTLVDTMVPRSAKKILQTAARTGRPIVRIVLTHAHGDHIGSLDDLAAALPGAEVIIGEREARLLPRIARWSPASRSPPLKAGYPGAKTVPTRTVAPGERIGSLEVVAAPGHTPGQIALLDTRDRTLICGDAFSTLGGWRPPPTRTGASRCRRSPAGIVPRRSPPPAPCARWSPRAWPPGTARSCTSQGPRWTRRSLGLPDDLRLPCRSMDAGASIGTVCRPEAGARYSAQPSAKGAIGTPWSCSRIPSS